MNDWAGKLAGAVARVAGLLHAADLAGVADPWSRPVSGRVMERAVRVGEYLIPHAQAAFYEMGCDPAVADARHVLAWVARRGGPFTRKECFDGTRSRFHEVKRLAPTLALLEDHRFLRKRPDPPRGPGHPASPTFDVNPFFLKGLHHAEGASERGPDAVLADSAVCASLPDARSSDVKSAGSRRRRGKVAVATVPGDRGLERTGDSNHLDSPDGQGGEMNAVHTIQTHRPAVLPERGTTGDGDSQGEEGFEEGVI
jgi:hypothetical protein